MKIAGIYKITNPVNGKCYVGQSWDIEKRWYIYRHGQPKGQVKLHHAFQKYGVGSFNFEVLGELPENGTQVDMDNLEIAWIAKLDCVKNGYNCKYGGLGGKCSEDTKRKISIARMGGRGNTVRHASGAEHGNWKGGQSLQGGFIHVLAPNHPRRDQKGYVLRAILVAETMVCRSLLPDEYVYHKDGVNTNDIPSNLEIVDMSTYRQRIRKAALRKRPEEVRTCVVCDEPVTRPRFRSDPSTTTCNLPRPCRNTLNGMREKKKAA